LLLFFLYTVPPSRSEYWKYFIRTNEGGKCNICQKIIKTSGNTTNLRVHLTRAHPKLQFQMKDKTDTDTTDTDFLIPAKQRKIMVINT